MHCVWSVVLFVTVIGECAVCVSSDVYMSVPFICV